MAGNQCDLRLYKSQLLALSSDIDVLMSSANEQLTLGDIATLGANLANEIMEHLAQMRGPLSRIRSAHALPPVLASDAGCSFIGHSLGSIIARAAVADPQFGPLRGKLHTYVSLSGPHLGTEYSDNSLVGSGALRPGARGAATG
jgi:hypothetical protein